MFPYIFIVLLLFFFIFKFDLKGNFSAEYIRAERLVLFILILFAGLRNRVGGDTIMYEAFFHTVPPLREVVGGLQDAPDKYKLQPLWFILNSIFRTFSDNFVWFQLFIAILFNFLIFRFIDKVTKFRFTSILLFFVISWWNLSFEVMRESICVALFVNSAIDLMEGNVKKYILWNLPSIFIHWFSAPLIAIVLLCHYLRIKVAIPVLITIAVCCLFFLDPESIFYYAMSYASLIGDSAELYTDMYLSDESELGFTNLSVFGIIACIIEASLSFVIFFSKRVREFKMEKIIILYAFLIVVTWCMPIFSRFLHYFQLIIIVFMVENLYDKGVANPIKISRLCCAIFLIMLCVQGCRNFYLPYSDVSGMSYNAAHIPYTTIFQEPDPVRESLYGI